MTCPVSSSPFTLLIKNRNNLPRISSTTDNAHNYTLKQQKHQDTTMASRNPESLVNQGEFTARKPRSEPMTTKGHAPGVQVGNDAVPEFHAETHPPGTAPKGNTFQPDPQDDVSLQAQSGTRTEVEDTLGGATSADVHAGLGKPTQGQTGQELHGDKHVGNRKNRERAGLEGTGASAGVDMAAAKGADRPEGVTKGPGRSEFAGATEKVPESASTSGEYV